MRYFIISALLISLTSCDAFLSLPYRVENKTQKPFTLRIKDYSTDGFLYTKDTIIILKPNKFVTVAYKHGVGFPYDYKKLYQEQKGVTNFEVLRNDSVLVIDKSDKNWKYSRGRSILKVKNI